MAFSDYVRAGWQLCAVPSGTKGPTYDEWNTKPIAHDAIDELPGAGLLHALSGTCVLDLDNLEAAKPWLAKKGIDLDALREADNAVHILSGRPNRDKLVYKLSRPLRTVKPSMSGLELRCATSTGSSVQDVLPPSIHPDTKKAYRWKGDWRELPAIPANLLTLWRELAEPIIAPPTDETGVGITKTKVNLESLREAVNRHDPDCEYDEWVKVGMQCHEGTHGHVKGFEIWNTWSVKSLKYPGEAALFAKYQSFGEAPGKNIVTAAALIAEIPAKAEDFDVVPTEATTSSPKAAKDKLIKRFTFIRFSEQYFDTETNCLLGDKAIQHEFTPYMPDKKDPIKILKESHAKVIADAMAFWPGAPPVFDEEKRRYVNAWYDTMPEPIAPMKDELDKIEWMFNRIDDPIFREYLRQFFAHIVQYPGIKIRTAPLVWSKIEGNGKSTLVHTIPKILVGAQFYTEVNHGELNSPHNEYLEGKWVAGLAEFSAGTRGERKEITKRVERWVADNMLPIHPKGTGGYVVPNHLVVTASSNDCDAAQITPQNRKWAVHWFAQDGEELPEMTEAEKQWLFEEFLNTDRAQAVLRHYFLNVPITTFNPNASAPHTKSRLEMIKAATPIDVETLLVAFEQKSEPFTREIVIVQDVVDFLRRQRIQTSNERVGNLLRDPPFNGMQLAWRLGKGTFRGVTFDRRWLNATGKEIAAHLNSEDVDITS